MVENGLMVEKIRRLTVDLPERRREVFVLRYFQGCSFEQIARLLNCSAGAARAAAFQASKQIRAWLACDCPSATIEHLDGELSDAEKQEVEEYLQAHPEAIELEGHFSLLCAAGKSIRESTFPADLLLEANRKLAARLADPRHKDVSTPVASDNRKPEIAPSQILQSNRRRRLRPPVLAAVLAALAILFVGVVTQRTALADIASSLLQRIVVTFNDEPLSDSQQQTFDELIEITETLDENGDQVVTVNVTTDQILQELGDGDGVLLVTVHGDESSEAVSSDSDPDSIVVNLDSLRSAKIGSQSPSVAEDKSWGDIKRAVDDSP